MTSNPDSSGTTGIRDTSNIGLEAVEPTFPDAGSPSGTPLGSFPENLPGSSATITPPEGEEDETALHIHVNIGDSRQDIEIQVMEQLMHIGVSMYQQFLATNDLELLKQAIGIFTQACHRIPEGHPSHVMALNNLGGMIVSRFCHEGDREDLDLGIGYHIKAIALCTLDDPTRIMTLANVARALQLRYDITADRDDVERMVEFWREVIVHRPVGHPRHEDAVLKLAEVLRLRAKSVHSVDDLQESNGLLRSIADLKAQDGPTSHITALQVALKSFWDSYATINDLVLLDDAITLTRDVLKLDYLSNTQRTLSLRSASTMFISRYRHTRDLSDCTIAIEYLDDALKLPIENIKLHSSILYNSASAHHTRFTNSEFPDQDDIDRGISLMKEAIELDFGGDTKNRIKSLTLLATLYGARTSPANSALAITHYEQAAELESDPINRALILKNVSRILVQERDSGEIERSNIPKEIETYNIILHLLPITHLEFPIVVRQRSRAMLLLFSQTNDITLLDAVIQCLTESLLSRDVTGYLEDLELICAATYSRYMFSRHEEDFEKVLNALQELLSNTHHHSLSTTEAILNGLLLKLAEEVDPRHPSSSIIVLDRALKAIPPSHYAYGAILYQLCGLRHTQWVLHGDPLDLQKAITLAEQARIIYSDNKPRLGEVLSVLGHCLHGRFHVTGSPEDSDNAIKLFQDALPLLETSVHSRARTLRGFASLLRNRYEVLGHREDLVYSLKMMEESLNLLSDDDPARAINISNLGYVYLDLYRHSSTKPDLDKAIEHFTLALQLRPPGHPDHRKTLVRLAEAMDHRALIPGYEGGIKQVKTLFRQSMELAPENDMERPRHLHVFRQRLLRYYTQSANKEELDEAIECHQQSVRLADPSHWLKAVFEHSLCEAYITRYASQGEKEDLDRALIIFGNALLDRQNEAAQNLTSAMHLLEAAENMMDGGLMVHLDSKQRFLLLDIYAKMVALLPRVAYFGKDTASRLQSLKQSEGLACNASALALSLSLPETALELLENGRAVFWAQALRLRPSADGLSAELGEQLRTVSRELEECSHMFQPTIYRESSENGESVRFIDEEASRLRRLGDKFESLLQEIRNLQGFEQFLKGAHFATSSTAAKHGPVVILIASQESCNAIIIRAPSASPQHLVLRFVNIAQLRTMARQMKTLVDQGRKGADVEDSTSRAGKISKLTGDGLLLKLWNFVVKPVIDALQLEKSQGMARPRLWWCPSGIFVSLPIHAAGDYSAGGSCCSEYVASSYTPTLQALCNAQQDMRPLDISTAKALSVAEPAAPNLPFLPNTIKESDVVSSILHGELCSSQRGKTTIASVMETMEDITVLHLACHGIQDSNSPLNSGFCLSNGRLTVSKLMQMSLPRAFFAFLSACESARGDASQPDQAIHLSATMLYCGFKSVIGTMWSMDDADGPEVARIVFTELFRDNHLDPHMIPYALDKAVHELRARGLPASRWATYIHVGA